MYNKYFLRLILNDVSLVHTFGWSLTGTATLIETLIGLSRVISTIRRILSDFPPFLDSKNIKEIITNSCIVNRQSLLMKFYFVIFKFLAFSILEIYVFIYGIRAKKTIGTKYYK